MASRDVRVRVRPDVVRGRARKTAPRTVVRVAAPHPQLNSQYAHLMESEDFFSLSKSDRLRGGGFYFVDVAAARSNYTDQDVNK